MSQAVRNRQYRTDNTVRGKEMLCGAVVSAKEYCTGRTEVNIYEMTPATVARVSEIAGVDVDEE